MGNPYQEEIHYRILRLLSQDRRLSQREMAVEMGVSLGKINYCLKELIHSGFVKISRFKNAQNKALYAYLLTPRGVKEKAEITVRFLQRKITEYEEIEKQIKELAQEAGVKDLSGCGLDELRA
ncbi:MAG: MarR family EPS-associated transcriptional regulator [Pseudomonadota bacterium]